MTERIFVTDPKLKAREEAAIADLQAIAPNGVITGLDNRDKALGKRLSKLYPRLGYESRRDMIEAFGFQYDDAAVKGGRRADMRAAEFVEEVCKQYESAQPFSTLTQFEMQLAKDRPDLASKLKTIKNKCAAELGDSFGGVLKQKGLVEDAAKMDDSKVEQAIEELKSLYANSDDKPKSISAIYTKHPEYGSLKSAFVRYVDQLNGMTPNAYFQELGILDEDGGMLTREYFEETMAQVMELHCQLNVLDRPQTIKEFIEMYTQYAETLTKAKNKHWLTKEYASENELLRPKKEGLKAYAAELRKREVEQRKQSALHAKRSELIALWMNMDLPLVIEEGSKPSNLLPEDVVALDINKRTEVVQHVYSKFSKRIENIDAVKENFAKKLEGENDDLQVVELSGSEYEGSGLVQAVCRQAVELADSTLLYGLYESGVLSIEDLNASGEWRNRYADALESNAMESVNR